MIRAIAAAMPPAALREQTEAAIDQFFRYLHEPEAEPSIPLSLAEFKRRVAGAELESAYVSMLQRKPAFDGAMPEVLLPVRERLCRETGTAFNSVLANLYRDGRDTLFRIHGTNEPWSIGNAASSGCIRMLNEHVLELFGTVRNGARVIVL